VQVHKGMRSCRFIPSVDTFDEFARHRQACPSAEHSFFSVATDLPTGSLAGLVDFVLAYTDLTMQNSAVRETRDTMFKEDVTQ